MTVAAVTGLLLVTLLIGVRGVAAMRTTSDFLVASRRTSPMLNAAAVSGEYLSAASFLGVAGLVLKEGTGALWYPVGFTAGYLLMLTLVAAPMRRSGALTVPGFAEARLGSRPLRRLCAVVVVIIAVLYLVPQLVAAGQLLRMVSGVDYRVGVVVSALVVGATLALGGMRAATYVQAFQFVLKLLLFAGPAIWLLLLAGPGVRGEMAAPPEFTHFTHPTPVEFRLDTELVLTEPTVVVVDGVPAALGPGPHEAGAGQVWQFPAGTPVPALGGDQSSLPVPGDGDWSIPLLGVGGGAPLLATWSMLLATALGTMGLPHVIVRFHTSPDGRGARRTAAITVAMLGAFYLSTVVYGLLGTVLTPELHLSQATDTMIVSLPGLVSGGGTATVLTALLTAGAFAAFLATSLGLLLALSGALAHDLMPSGLRRLRLTALAAAATMVPIALLMVRVDVSAAVTSAFTVAASTFCPLLVLGLWWKGLTARGAYAGMVTGLVCSLGSMAASSALRLGDVADMLLTRPALWSIPVAFIVMIVLSMGDHVPSWAEDTMLRLHLADRD